MTDVRSVLVTGGEGFIGRHLVSELERSGNYLVRSIDKSDGDLTVPGNARRLIGHIQPDIVVHLAAQVGRLFGERDAEFTITSNAIMTTFVAQAAASVGAQLVYASTSEVYGDQGDNICREHGPFSLPHNLYGLSKRWGEETCRLYCPDALVTLRFSMPYGPGVPPGRGRRAMDTMLWQAHTGQPIVVHRGAERSWCWIGDTVAGVRLILDRRVSGPFNVGRDDVPLSMEAMAEMACHMAKAPLSLIELVDPPQAQTVVKRLSTERLRALGWAPHVDLYDGMRDVYAWIKNFDRNGELVA